MKKPQQLLLLMLCIALVQTASSQWVTVPDQAFKNYLTNTMPQCMNGDQMNTQCPAVINQVTIMQNGGFGSSYIMDLTGLEHFTNLQNLHMSFQPLHTIPAFPPSLKLISIGGGDFNYGQEPLTSLPPLPPGLEKLFVFQGSMSNLPDLPPTLTHLGLQYGLLSEIPELPAGLKYLQIFENEPIDALPAALPSELEYLDVSYNSISSLPQLPSTLKELRVSGNPLGSLPSLPPQLEILIAQYNDLIALPELPSTLRIIDVTQNQLTSLPELPSSLEILTCDNCALSSLPALPETLLELHLESNQLTALPPLPQSIKIVDANDNALAQIEYFPEGLEIFYCSFCDLAQLPELPSTLKRLDVYGNQLTSLPALPSGILYLQLGGNFLTCLPEIPESLAPPPFTFDAGIEFEGNYITCVPNYISPSGNYELGQYPICAEFDTDINPNGCASGSEGIYGRIFLDDDSNCAYTDGEQYIYGIPVKIYDQSGTLLSQMNSYGSGLYSFYENYGNYDVKIDTANKPFTVECASIGVQLPVSTSLSAPLSQNNNFALKCKPGYDIAVNSITRSGWIFPGQQHIININAGDVATWFNINCSDGTEAQVTFTVDGPVQYVEPYDLSPAPDVISGNTFTFNLGDVADWGNTQIRLLFETDTTAQADDLICVDAYITPDADDLFPANNFKNHCFPVVNSYDPNMKEVWPVDVLPGYDGYFTYTIHFQNTGSAPAFNIKLRDTLSSLLDLNTFEVVHSSHPHTMTLNGQHLRFFFNNIMLPDSTSNEPESKGYVQYRVKPLPGLDEGSVIENTAYIYFDFNEPIITNTTANQFIQPLGTGNYPQRLHARIWPNPGKGKFYLSLPASEMGSIDVFDIAGRKVHSQISEGPQTELELSHLPTGLYMAKIVQGADMATVKIVKQ